MESKELTKKRIKSDYIRNIIFGAEDSLVSTVGVVFGVASTSAEQKIVITTGLLVIVVEALSMGAGSFLSEQSTKDMEKTLVVSNPAISGTLMFFSYFISGFITLVPYVFAPVEIAKYISVGIALVFLFIIGFIPNKSIRAGFRMLIIAGLAVLVGFAIGSYFGNNNV